MKIYSKAVANIEDFDPEMLRNELAEVGLPIVGVYPGNRVLKFEFAEPLTDEQKTTLVDTVDAHAPIWFTWTENGQSRSQRVRCGEDVDRITGRRIRALIGGEDAVQEQLKAMRLSAWSHEVRLQVLEGGSVPSEDIAMANSIKEQMLAVNTAIETIRTEGKNFKISKGW